MIMRWVQNTFLKEATIEMIQMLIFHCNVIIKVLEKCTKNLIEHSRLAFNNHESNIDC